MVAAYRELGAWMSRARYALPDAANRIEDKAAFNRAPTVRLGVGAYPQTARGKSPAGRFACAAGANARRRENDDTGLSRTSANEAGAAATPCIQSIQERARGS